MIFHKETQRCFFNPTKNGTHTLRKILKENGWHTVSPLGHAYPEDLMARFPNLVNYKTFVFFRNPLDRFESFVLFLKQKRADELQEFLEQHAITKPIETLSYDDVVDLFDKFTSKWGGLVAPQVNWMRHPGTEILDFDNFESELRRVTGITSPIPCENKSSDWGKSVITDKVRLFVRDRYAADYALAKDRLGKEYA